MFEINSLLAGEFQNVRISVQLAIIKRLLAEVCGQSLLKFRKSAKVQKVVWFRKSSEVW